MKRLLVLAVFLMPLGLADCAAEATPITFNYTGNPYTDTYDGWMEGPSSYLRAGIDYLSATAVLDITPGVAAFGLAASSLILRTTTAYPDESWWLTEHPCEGVDPDWYCEEEVSNSFDVDEQGNITRWYIRLVQIGVVPYLELTSTNAPDHYYSSVNDFVAIDGRPDTGSSFQPGIWSAVSAPKSAPPPPNHAAVPEPGSVLLLGIGLIGMLGLGRKCY